MSTLFPDTDDAEILRAHAEATKKVGYPAYSIAAQYNPTMYDGERQFLREARYTKPLYALTHGPVDAQGDATGLDHDVLMKVMENLPGRAPWQEAALRGEGFSMVKPEDPRLFNAIHS